MNAIAQRTSASIPANLPEAPRLSRPVGHAMTVALEPIVGRGIFGEDDPGHRVQPPLLAPTEWEEAQRAAGQFDALLQPVEPHIIIAWLLPLNFAARNPQSQEQFDLRARAIAELVGDLPAAAFTTETRRKLGTGFFPSAQDVREAIEPIADDWRRKRDALRGLHRAVAPKAGKADPVETPEEKASYAELNARTVQALKDQLAERERAAKPGGGKTMPALLTPEQRIIEYHRLGQHAVAAAIAKANNLDVSEVLDRARQGLIA